MEKCLFCGGIKKLSREHIIPKWLLKELGLTEEKLIMRHITIFGMTKSKRTHDFKNLVNAMICEDCNNGWMSKLEVSAKDLVIRLMNLDDIDKDVFKSLSENYEILAKWSFKTAIVLNYPTNYRHIVPENHFHSLYSSKIPKGVYINLAFTNNIEIIQWRQSQTVIMIGNLSEYSSRLKRVYKITLQFRHLLLRVCHIPFEDFIQGYGTEGSIALWPQLGRYKDFKIYKNIGEFDLSNYFIQTQNFA